MSTYNFWNINDKYNLYLDPFTCDLEEYEGSLNDIYIKQHSKLIKSILKKNQKRLNKEEFQLLQNILNQDFNINELLENIDEFPMEDILELLFDLSKYSKKETIEFINTKHDNSGLFDDINEQAEELLEVLNEFLKSQQTPKPSPKQTPKPSPKQTSKPIQTIKTSKQTSKQTSKKVGKLPTFKYSNQQTDKDFNNLLLETNVFSEDQSLYTNIVNKLEPKKVSIDIKIPVKYEENKPARGQQIKYEKIGKRKYNLYQTADPNIIHDLLLIDKNRYDELKLCKGFINGNLISYISGHNKKHGPGVTWVNDFISVSDDKYLNPRNIPNCDSNYKSVVDECPIYFFAFGVNDKNEYSLEAIIRIEVEQIEKIEQEVFYAPVCNFICERKGNPSELISVMFKDMIIPLLQKYFKANENQIDAPILIGGIVLKKTLFSVFQRNLLHLILNEALQKKIKIYEYNEENYLIDF